MDDLISRKAAIEATEDPVIKGYVMNALKNVPSVPAVPLDKLCEWLQDNAALTHGTLISAAGWKYELKLWMEGLDAAD